MSDTNHISQTEIVEEEEVYAANLARKILSATHGHQIGETLVAFGLIVSSICEASGITEKEAIAYIEDSAESVTTSSLH